MKLLLTLVLVGAIAAQSNFAFKAYPCTSRSLACPADLQPVCGFTTSGNYGNFGNSCTACSRADVQGYIPGYCSSINPYLVDYSAFVSTSTQPSRPFVVSWPRRRPLVITISGNNQSPGNKIISVPQINAPPPARNPAYAGPLTPPAPPTSAPTPPPSPSPGAGPSADSLLDSLASPGAPAVSAASYQQVCLTRTPACTRELRYVCGKRQDGSTKTYNNKCLACAEADVVSFSQGRCPLVSLQPPAANLTGPVAVCLGKPVVCTLIFAPVCGKLNNGDLKNYSSNCSACAAVGVVGYWSGPCPAGVSKAPSSAPSLPAGAVKCTTRSKICTFIYMPVCAQKNDGSSKTYPSNCSACADDSVAGFVAGGPCPGDDQAQVPTVKPIPIPIPLSPVAPVAAPASGSVTCTSRSPACTREYFLVCGTKSDGTTQEYSNKCVACSDSNVVSYVNGSCSASSSGPSADSLIEGLPVDSQANGPSVDSVGPSVDAAPVASAMAVKPLLSNCKSRNPGCPFNIAPVCGRNLFGEETTYDNECLACSNKSTVGFYNGACPKPRPVTGILSNCQSKPQFCTGLVLPVCGKTITGELKPYENNCTACQNNLLAGYYDYPCSDVTTPSTPVSPPVTTAPALKNCQSSQPNCPFLLNPVCGKTITGTLIDYENSCLACQNKVLAGYTDGKCPKPTTPAKPLLQSCSSRNPVCGYILDPVCGRTITGEEKTYDNPCLACQNKLLAGFYQGRC